MKLTDTLTNINLALNYPALTYEDIRLYFDMAIAELNTTLHTSIPTVSKMIEAFRQNMSKNRDNQVVIDVDPEQNDFVIPVLETDGITPSNGYPKFYYSTDTRLFYAWNIFSKTHVPKASLIGTYVRQGIPERYASVVNQTEVYWVRHEDDPIEECELADYLPDDWVLLWLIPYVCFKYTVRDGGTAQTFAEEMQQGFQQLQDTYSVPARVILATFADRIAYKDLVEEHLPNLNVVVRTRAIYEDMKHGRNINAVYGNMFDRGGF